jgi:hypothetical protein
MNGYRAAGRVNHILSMLCPCAAAFLAGCVQMTPVPGYARSGDTLVLGLGGIQRNARGHQTMSPADLVITITDSAKATHTLTPQQPFKVFPDYGSQLNYQTIGGNSTMSPLPIQPFDGGWFVPVSLTRDGVTTPIAGLAPGRATISITSPTGKLVNNPSTGNYGVSQGFLKEGNLIRIPVEIIAGTGDPASDANKDYNNQLRAYGVSGVSSFNVAPGTLKGISTVGGVQLAIKYSAASTKGTNAPLVVPYSHNPSINLQQNVIENGDGTKTINILLTAPQGFAATPTSLKPSLRDLNLKVIYFGGSSPGVDFQIVSSKYIDTSGGVIPGLNAVIGPVAL